MIAGPAANETLVEAKAVGAWPGGPLHRTLVVGFGHSGHFHLDALRKLEREHTAEEFAHEPVGVVDPYLDRLDVHGDDGPLTFFRTLEAARGEFAPDLTVVHVCTPPATHAEVLRAAVEAGYRKFVVEKPMANTLRDVESIRRLEEAHDDVQILVVANWLVSRLTDAVGRHLAETEPGVQVTDVALRQAKPRFSRSLANYSHKSVFDVELPHLVALACRLFGTDLRLVTAHCTDMVVNDVRLPSMGTGHIGLATRDGTRIRLYSDLASPLRERSIRVAWSDGRSLWGHYPCSSLDHHSQLMLVDESERLVDRAIFYDDTFRAFMTSAYAYLHGAGPKPVSDVELNAAVCTLLVAAKAACGLGEAEAA